MKRIFILPLFIGLFSIGCHQTTTNSPADLPDSIYSGRYGTSHNQGIAVDQKHGFVYFSFTDKLIKTDLSGHFIGSVTGLVGHLGDLAYDPKTNTVYGSLEYKNDVIGNNIRKKHGLKQNNDINFYIAMFDVSKIDQANMDAVGNDILKTIYLKEVVKDYKDSVMDGNQKVQHRFGCSGIDGVTLGPSFGKPDSKKKYLYVAYGIYGDTTRDDNDHQVILKYDYADWRKLGKELTQKQSHHSGPDTPLAKYFVYTGNTTWGTQNLAYDPSTGNYLAAVYQGKKSQFPNYRLFVIDGHQSPGIAEIKSDNKKIKVKTLSLLQAGLKDPKTGIRGWNFRWGSTGLFPLGNGYFYISHKKKVKGEQTTTIYKYKWIGDKNKAFKKIKDSNQ